MASKLRLCPQCGRKKKLQYNQITCSMVCRVARLRVQQATMTPGACMGCNESKPLIYGVKGIRVCSAACRGRIWGRMYRAAGLPPVRVKRNSNVETICEHCSLHFVSRRYDQRFCSKRCMSNWHYKFGDKGIRVRAKRLDMRQARDARIGKCALCGTSHTAIIPINLLGGYERAGAAKFHRDHIECRSHGGGELDDNFRWLCWFCNLARRNMKQKYDPAISAAGKAFWKSIKIPYYAN